MRRLLLLLVLALGSLAATAPSIAAQTVDVIRGRVVGNDSLPLENVTVTVTSISGNVNRTARTDRNGRYTVTFPGGDGDYLVSMNILGYAAKRFEIKRAADEDILIADAKLTKVGAVLDQVKVTAAREKVARTDASPPDISGTERTITNAGFPPDMMGDLAAMAASLPGVNLVPGQDGGANGFSVLGLGADQNNSTLNGLNFGGSGLPRDASVLSGLVTSPYDVSRGGFSGGQFSLRTRPGSNFIARTMSTTVDAPQLQWSDRAARSLGQEYSNLSLGGLVSGPLIFDKAFYNIAYQLGHRSSDLLTLLNTDATGLQTSGVAVDSARRFVNLLQNGRVPTTVSGLPNNKIGDSGSLFGSIDFTPPTSNSGQSFNVTFNGSWNKQDPVTGLTTSIATAGGDRTFFNGGIQGRHSGYFTLRGIGILTETSGGINASNNQGAPFADLPGGRVRVNSLFADGTNSVQNLTFGGNQFLGTSSKTTSISALNTLSWFSANNKHRLKLTSELRRDDNAQDQTINRLGTYSYNSLAELQAGIPASFTRSLSPRTRNSSIMIGALSLGDSWRKSSDFQLQYGVRLDGNVFLNGPAYNADVDRLFGVRNDRAPNGIFVSPRVGFSYTYGTAAQIGAFEGAFRGPRAVVRGGVGIFQNSQNAGLIGSAIDNTGLPSAVQQLICIGPAVPIPDWGSFVDLSRIPTTCANGSSGTFFSNGAPNVTLFAKDFAPPRSLRSNLQWNGPILGNRFNATLEGTYSYNTKQSSFIDLNFAPTQRFVLNNENGRPVYVLGSSIVPLTGAIAAGDARVAQTFGRVSQQTSDLNSESRQVSFRLSPSTFSTNFGWSASYVYGNVREQYRGFTSTAANPLDVAWGRASSDSRHQIVYNLQYNAFDFVRFSWNGQFRSGSPFTPTVAGDINGDGYSNDRAFIFSPTSGNDALLASGMQSLLSGGSAVARACLNKQLGRIADRNSCQGPWTSTANLSISLNPLKFRLPQRATLSFNVSNPLGAADLLLHGEGKLRGWGQQPFVDQSLLYVRGFDPATNRYKYEVNQRFGATSLSTNVTRAPVVFQMLLRYDIGPTRERQLLTQNLDRGRTTRGTKTAEPTLKAQFGNGGVPNPMATMLRDQDTLKLTADQADSLASMNRRYTVRLDSIWSPIMKQFSLLPDRYDHDRVYDQYRRAREASIDLLITLSPTISQLLTAEQRRRLPSFVSSTLDKQYLSSIRSGTAGGGFGFGGGGGGGGGGQFVGGGGGGGQQVIIMR